MFRENVCANMDVNQFGSVLPTSSDPLGISLLSFFLGADDTSPHDLKKNFFLHFTSASLPLPANSALIPPPITLSPPITRNQEKHTPAGLGEVMRLSTLAG